MAKLIDLTGQKIDKLTVLEKASSRCNHVYWKCICECGNYCEKSSEYLRSSLRPRDCGCSLIKNKKIKAAEERFNRHIGERYGNLTVIANTGKRTNKEPIWLCKCDCGNYKEVPTGALRTGHTQSCGCLRIGAHSEDITGNKYGKLTVLVRDPDFPEKWICKCECGNLKSITSTNLRKGITSSCGCINYSIGEYNINKLLTDNNISFKKEYTDKELKQKRFDFAILNDNNEVIRLIEYDGEQHYKPDRGDWDKHDCLEARQ